MKRARGWCLLAILALAGLMLPTDIGDTRLAGLVGVPSDFNGDGVTDPAVGIPGLVRGTTTVGGVQVYDGKRFAAGDHSPTGPLLLGRTANGSFGATLVTGDFDGDGAVDLVVGAPAAATVTVHFGQPGAPLAAFNTARTRVISGKEPGGRFGAAMASADFTGDSLKDLAVGAPDEAGGCGRVVVFISAPGSGPGPGRSIDCSGVTTGEHFGAALAGVRFGPGVFAHLAVGSPEANRGATRAGAVTLIPGGSGGPDPTRAVVVDLPALGFEMVAVGAAFGTAFAAGGFFGGQVHLAVGAPGQGPDGVVLVIDADGGLVTTVAPHGQQTPRSRFGAVLAAGDLAPHGADDLVVGRPTRVVGPLSVVAGGVDVYRPGVSSFDLQAQLAQGAEPLGEVPETGDLLGSAIFVIDVDGRDAEIFVGAPGEDIGGAVDGGMVHVVFDGNVPPVQLLPPVPGVRLFGSSIM